MKVLLLFLIIFTSPLQLLANEGPSIQLTEIEREHLQNLGVITMCVDPDWVPFEHVDEEGNFTGIAADLVELVSLRLGIPFEIIYTDHWDETLECSRAGECLLIPFLNKTEAREEWLLFTEPIFTDPNVFITREERPFIGSPSDLTNETIVLPSGTSIEEFIRNNHPDMTIITTPTEMEAFHMVTNREADMTLRSLIIAAYTIRSEGFFNLKIAGQFPELTNHLRMGVLKEYPELVEILNKAIVSITPKERQEIVNRHVYIKIEEPINYTLIFAIAGVLSLLSFVAFYWNINLKKLNEERRILLDNIQTQIWYMTDELTYGAVNQAHANFYGLEVLDLSFKDMRQVYPPHLVASFEQVNREVFLSGQEMRTERWVENSAGEKRLLSILRMPKLRPSGSVEYIVCSAEDITKRREMEEQLRSKAALQELIAEISASFINSDTENIDEKIQGMLEKFGLFFDAPQAFLYTFSSSSKEIAALYFWSREEDPPQKKQGKGNELPFIIEAMGEGQLLFISDAHHLPNEDALTEELKRQSIQAALYLPLIKNKHLLGCFGFYCHTAKEDLEDGQVELLKILGNTIADALTKNQMEEAMKNAKVQADRANAAKSEFLANMSHEIRTPLNAIIGFTGLGFKTDPNSKQHEYLKKIDSASKLLLSTINNILDFSKIEAGKMELEWIFFYLLDSIENVSSILAQGAFAKGLDLFFFIQKDTPKLLKGDPLRLEQILMNLISNAIKFTEEGEIVVHVSPAKQTEDKKESRDTRAEIFFSVKDTGIGIAKDQQLHLFHPFMQVDGSTTRKYGGTGLGLAISKSLVEMMDGEIKVEGQVGEGSLFSFTATFSLEEEAPPLYSPPKGILGRRVLIIDGNTTSCRILEEMLTSFSLEAEIAPLDGDLYKLIEEASEKDPYSLAIIDEGIVERDRGLLEELSRASLPYLFLVKPHSHEAYGKRGIREGGGLLLKKPVMEEDLFNSMMEIWGQKEAMVRRREADPSYSMGKKGVFSGLSALLVEDSPINQELVRELLEEAGLTISIVSHGAQAVSKVLEGELLPYDVILMDLQMPVMDGFEATKRIRERYSQEELPIIALTAHAILGDREKCLAAGMNDYITKPIDSQQLFRALERWIKPRRSPLLSSSLKHREGLSSTTTEKIRGLDVQGAIERMGGRRDLYEKIAKRFIQENRDTLPRIEEALEKGDRELALRLAHTLKGEAGSIGALLVEEGALQLEEAITQGGEIKKRQKDLHDALGHLLERLEERAREGNTRSAHRQEALHKRSLKPLVDKLDQLLQEGSFAAMGAFESLKEAFLEGGAKGELKDLERHIEAFAMEEAREELKRLGARLSIDRR